MCKNEVYLDMLFWVLPHIRNMYTHSPFYRYKDKSVYYESMLVCQFHSLLVSDEFNDQDVLFLNNQARWYYENCDKTKSILYPSQLERIKSLFVLVPEGIKDRLEWKGPLWTLRVCFVYWVSVDYGGR